MGRKERFMRTFLIIVFIVALTVITVSAQSERELKDYFESKQITLRIAIPRTGRVDIYSERNQPLDFKDYTERLNVRGAALHRAETAAITRLNVHSNSIEVILAGTNAGFDIHFNRLESWMLTPATVVDALSRYVEFTDQEKNAARLQEGATDATGYVRKGVVHIGPRTTYLKQGLKPDEVISFLGTPASISESKRQGQSLLVYEFQRSGDRVLIAEFVNGRLIASRTETRSVALATTSVTKTP